MSISSTYASSYRVSSLSKTAFLIERLGGLIQQALSGTKFKHSLIRSNSTLGKILHEILKRFSSGYGSRFDILQMGNSHSYFFIVAGYNVCTVATDWDTVLQSPS